MDDQERNKDDADIFTLLHTMQLFTNQAAIKWTKVFGKEIGISPLLVLAELRDHGPQKQSELAAKLGFTPGAITNIADKLIKKNYAVREFDEKDRRIIYLAITEDGIDILHLADDKGKQVKLELFQILSQQEREQLLHIYQKLSSQFR